jgi:hypothetical protein
VATCVAFVVHVCRVVRLIPLQGVYLFESLGHPRIWMGLARGIQM